MTNTKTMERSVRGNIRRLLAVALLTVAAAGTLSAQALKVRFPEKTMRADRAMETVHQQSGMNFVTSGDFDPARSVDMGKFSLSVADAAAKIAGKDFDCTIRERYILIHRKADKKQPLQYIDATVADDTGAAMEGLRVEIAAGAKGSAETDALGHFHINSVPAGRYILKLTPADGREPLYKEVATSANPWANTRVTFADIREEVKPAAEPVVPVREYGNVPTYYYNKIDKNKAYDFSYAFVEARDVYKGYRPKVALKTNLLIWGTTTPNLSVEARLGRRWTLDVGGAYNPWKFGDDKRHSFWFAQPELRYWFCESFENHFVGLHGVYAKYDIGNTDLLTTTFKNYRYDGKAYGGGISYGYHLPIGRHWGMEFTVGVGFLRLEYDKYNCPSCEVLHGTYKKDYIGPTKAGITLIFMIK